jgi:hypothetical protein
MAEGNVRRVSLFRPSLAPPQLMGSVDPGSDKIRWAAGMLIVGKESSRSIQWFSTLSNGR